MSDPPPLLLYDGLCALCNGWVRFLLRVDRGGPLRFAALASATGDRIRTAHPELTGVDSLVFVEGERAAVRSTAVLRIFRYLGGPWRLFLIGWIVPREIRDSLYDVVAFWRYRLFGRHAACLVPPADARGRFLD